MNARWLWFDHIPPELGLTRAARRRVRLAVNEKDEYVLLRTVPALIPFFVFYLVWLEWIAEMVFGAPLSGWAAALEMIAFVAAAQVMTAALVRRARIRLMREALRHEGYELCMNCGYWLRGLRDDAKQCPECGAKREPMPEAESIS